MPLPAFLQWFFLLRHTLARGVEGVTGCIAECEVLTEDEWADTSVQKPLLEAACCKAVFFAADALLMLLFFLARFSKRFLKSNIVDFVYWLFATRVSLEQCKRVHIFCRV